MHKKKTSYAADFLKSLFQVHNLPALIYLCVNFALIFVGAIALPRLVVKICTELQLTLPAPLPEGAPYYWMVLGSVCVFYILVFALSLCRVGEWVLRLRLHCRKIKNKDHAQRIQPLFDEVYRAARSAAPSIPGHIHLYMQKSTQANAFAVGRRCVCITRGLLALPDEEIKGILAHEFGHLAHKDTDMNLAVSISGGMTNFFLVILWLAYLAEKIVQVCIQLFTVGFNSPAIEGPLTELVLAAVAIFVVRVLQSAWTALGNLLLTATSRSREYKADAFSCKLGYARGLLGFFYRLPDAHRGGKNWLKRFGRALLSLGATHPATWKRIANVRKLYGSLPTPEENMQ